MTIYHNHHIVPKHMGGTDDPKNLKKLTVEEHAAAHKALYEEHGDDYDKWAWMGLLKMVSREEIISRVIATSNVKNKTGIPHTEEHKAKVSASMKGKKKSAEHVRKQSASHKGTGHPPASAETKKKCSESAKKDWARRKALKL